MFLTNKLIQTIEEILKQNQITEIKPQELILEERFGKRVQIGKGGFGKVYKGQYKSQNVAIKKIKFKETETPETCNFVQEIKIHSQLKHQRILQLIGVCLERHLYIVTPFQRASLDKAIHKQQIFSHGRNQEQRNMKLDYLIKIAEGIQYLHTYNPPIVHRDLKPSNILIDNNGGIKIADLGLAVQSSTIDASEIPVRNAAGSLKYMAPESFGQRKIHINSDI